MKSRRIKRDVARGERVLPGLWRLRLPLSIPGVPHCNAYAIAANGGVVLVDCGMPQPGSFAGLESALKQVGFSIDDVRLLVCTHAHIDHCGQAKEVLEQAGCEFWIHPNFAHFTETVGNPVAARARAVEIGRLGGVPETQLKRYLDSRVDTGPDSAGVLPPHRDLIEGVKIATDLGEWETIETPGHAPSHICLYQPEHRVLISGDHLLGRISLYYDYGFSPDPVGQFLDSLSRVERLDARLSLAGHGRPFIDVKAHIEANRALVESRLSAIKKLLTTGSFSAYETAQRIYGDEFTEWKSSWLIVKTLCYLEHLARLGEVSRQSGEPELWTV